ncbi:hypothetical protein VTK56DRAFT_2665 [Thermocarpiscus australiensis]
MLGRAIFGASGIYIDAQDGIAAGGWKKEGNQQRGQRGRGFCVLGARPTSHLQLWQGRQGRSEQRSTSVIGSGAGVGERAEPHPHCSALIGHRPVARGLSQVLCCECISSRRSQPDRERLGQPQRRETLPDPIDRSNRRDPDSGRSAPRWLPS